MLKEEDQDLHHTFTDLDGNNYETLEEINLSGPFLSMEIEQFVRTMGPDGLDVAPGSLDVAPGSLDVTQGSLEDTLDASDASGMLHTLQPPIQQPYTPISRRGPPERTVTPGSLNFHVEINASDTHRKKYLYSAKLNCIYVNMKTCFSVQFRWEGGRAPRPMYVRATAVFADDAQAEKRVERCTQHVHDPSNANLSENIIRNVLHSAREISTAGVYYCGDPAQADSWYSVVVEFSGNSEVRRHAYQFGCKNSCTSGINRRATAIIFELEDANGEVYGRQCVNARSCACPRRDMVRDEEAAAPPPANKRPLKDGGHNKTKKIKLEVVAQNDVITLPPVEIVGVKAVIAGLGAMLASMEYDASQKQNDSQTQEKYKSRIDALKTQIEHYKNMKAS